MGGNNETHFFFVWRQEVENLKRQVGVTFDDVYVHTSALPGKIGDVYFNIIKNPCCAFLLKRNTSACAEL